MPYKVEKSGDGFKVFKKGSSKSYSKEPLTKEKAQDQMKAMYANSNESTSKFLDLVEGLTAEVEGQEVKIGDYIWFKSDTEQGAEIIDIKRHHNYPNDRVLVVKAPENGFQGEYIKFDQTAEIDAERAWI